MWHRPFTGLRGRARRAAGGLAGSHRRLRTGHPWAASERMEEESSEMRKAAAESGPFLAHGPLSLADCTEPARPPRPKWSVAASQRPGSWRGSGPLCCAGWEVLRRGAQWMWGSRWSSGVPCCSVTGLVGRRFGARGGKVPRALSWTGGEALPATCRAISRLSLLIHCHGFSDCLPPVEKTVR